MLKQPAARAWLGLACCAGALVAPAADAYGPAGHRIAGEVAEDLLCERAAAEIARLGVGASLSELGVWADEIRGNPEYAQAAAWHYVNIDDGMPLAELVHPPEGDVLWAIDRFAARLGNERLDDAARAEALKFLVHFVVDLHQPLHVGLAEDRGGNDIALRFRGELTNLHRFWDTHAIEQAELPLGQYVQSLRAALGEIERPDLLDPVEWAAESLAVRPRVYAFGAIGEEPGQDYLDWAADLTRVRLAQASARLAGLLNRLLCD